MSEGVLIALITSIGALIGGIASAVINSYAIMKAADKKQASPQATSNNTNHKFRWSWSIFFIGAIIGAIGVLGVASFAGLLPIRTSSELVPLYRYHNLLSGDYVYTINRNANLDQWIFEGNEGYVYATEKNGTIPLYEFYNQDISQHFYATDRSAEGREYNYKLQGIVAYVYSEQIANTVPLYRYFNGSNGAHFYTINFGELGSGKKGFMFEEIECYVFAKVP